jgi:hypothetical protein
MFAATVTMPALYISGAQKSCLKVEVVSLQTLRETVQNCQDGKELSQVSMICDLYLEVFVKTRGLWMHINCQSCISEDILHQDLFMFSRI